MSHVRMSVSQVAARWGCSRQHIYNMIRRGELPAFRVGSLYRLKAEDVIAHEERQIHAPVPPPTEPAQRPAQPVPQRFDNAALAAHFAAQRILARRNGR
jgi:excisionase family DNA binding protein